MLFSFVVAPVSFKDMDQGRADRQCAARDQAGARRARGVCVLAAIAALISARSAPAVVAGICGAFYIMCQWALAPRDEQQSAGHVS